MKVLEPVRERRNWFTWGATLLVGSTAFASAIPWSMKRAVDAIEAHRPSEVASWCLLLAGLAIGGALFRVASRIFIFNGARLIEYDLRNDLYGHLMAMPPPWYQDWQTGDLMSRVTNDVSYVRLMYGPGILNLVNTACAYAMALPLLLLIDPALALYTLIPIPLMLAASRNLARTIQHRQRAVQDELARMSARLHEGLSGVAVVKALGMDDRERSAFDERNGTYLERSMELVVARGLFMPLVGSVAGIGTLIVLFSGGHAVSTGRISIGDLVAFMGYLGMLTWPTLALGWVISSWQRGRAAFDRIVEVLSEQPSIADPPDPVPLPDPRGALEIRDLSVTYDDTAAPALDSVSVSVVAGGSLGIVGPTGSGKTTLVRALPRLLSIPTGTVFLDGHDATSLSLSDLRGAIALVPQESFLFSSTLLENLALSHPEPTSVAGRQAVLEAARLSAFDRDVQAFADGYDTVVGERGITLSGGQKQRACIARALVADRRVLVLDDALSSVDAETEQAILEGLREAARGRTTVVVSHRLSAVAWCDQVIVLDAGRVVDRGTHEELLSRGGWYADMWHLQRATREVA